MAVSAVEVVYRGIFQKSLSRNICRSIVLAARKEGKIGTAFSRYSDSPERNGIPAKYFAVVAGDPIELEETLARYQPTAIDVTIVLDDTLCKGVESWAWQGLHPANELTVQGGTVLVTSIRSADELLANLHVKEVPYNLSIVKGAKSFSGLWVYKDDHTDARILGALARVCPKLVGLEAYKETIFEESADELKVGSAQRAYERVSVHPVEPGQGNPEVPAGFDQPGWTRMEEALVIRAIGTGGGFRGGESGFQATRSEVFKKWSTRTMRPVVNFETCTKCTLCWLQCPDTCFDVTPEGLYDVDLEACCGCGVCQDVCPVADCITMVNESSFTDNSSQYDRWNRDRDGYVRWLDAKLAAAAAEKAEVGRSHGLRGWGDYEEEIAMRGVADDD
jgi:pyruvate ferredoxin oxidoreductase delta subunit